MKHIMVTATLVATVTTSASPLACGDKFLVPGRSARFQVLKIDRENASVLLYASPGSGWHRTLSSQPVEATLRKAGYRPVRVGSEAELRDALSRERWDVVLLDLADGTVINAAEPPQRPVVLPVAHDASKSDLTAARSQYRQVLRAPAKPTTFVEAIDVIVARARSERRAGAR